MHMEGNREKSNIAIAILEKCTIWGTNNMFAKHILIVIDGIRKFLKF